MSFYLNEAQNEDENLVGQAPDVGHQPGGDGVAAVLAGAEQAYFDGAGINHNRSNMDAILVIKLIYDY